jgi:serine protease
MAVAWWRGLSVALLLAVAGVAVPVAAQGTGPATRLIVKFKPDPAKRVLDPQAELAALAVVAGTAVTYERALLVDAHLVRLPQVRTSGEADAIAARLEQLPQVEYAERSRVWKAQRAANDTYFPTQFYLRPGATTIDAVGAWDVTTGAPEVVVAVIDSGILPHADLALRTLPGYDFIVSPSTANDGDERDADPSDPGDWIDAADLAGSFAGQDCEIARSSWHGTAVAGAIAANGNNGRYAAGMDWSARILPLRALGKCGGDDFDIAEALAWAGGLPITGVPDNPHPAHVVNLSLGSDGACPKYFQNVVNLVFAKGFTRAIVASAGNRGTTAAHTPSDCVGVISVTATNDDGTRASYANYGSRIDIAAPGGNARSSGGANFLALTNRGRTIPEGDTIAYYAGTSLATPLVSGTVALMLSLAPQLTPTQLRDIIKASAKPFPAMSGCTPATCGAGILDAAGAVRTAAAFAAPASPVTLVEYYHAALDHYFITWVPAEIAGLDGGITSQGWTRTGLAFNAFAALQAGTSGVCRIYIPPGRGDGHYFGRDQAECITTLTAFPSFVQEAPAFFYLYPAASGACAAGTLPVYRLYSNRPDANHRYTTNRAVRDAMVASGWLAEGDGPDAVLMCAPA